MNSGKLVMLFELHLLSNFIVEIAADKVGYDWQCGDWWLYDWGEYSKLLKYVSSGDQTSIF